MTNMHAAGSQARGWRERLYQDVVRYFISTIMYQVVPAIVPYCKIPISAMYHNVTNASENADKQVQLDQMEGHESLNGE